MLVFKGKRIYFYISTGKRAELKYIAVLEKATPGPKLSTHAANIIVDSMERQQYERLAAAVYCV